MVLGFELRASTLRYYTSPFLWWIFFKTRSHKVFAQAGFDRDPPDLCLLSS
jgi:hypothetical protein